MEMVNQAGLSGIQRLPDELLARLFVVGSWLPGRMLAEDSLNLNPREAAAAHPPRLKPYAKLVSQVCARWHSIVYWHSNQRELYHASISLNYSNDLSSGQTEIVPILKAYLDSITNSGDAELDVEWHFSVMVLGQTLAVPKDLLVPLFLHGMNLTAPHFNRVRSLKVNFEEPEVVGFFFLLINSLGDDSALQHLQVSLFEQSGSTLVSEPPFMPCCAPFHTSLNGSTFHPTTRSTALSHLGLVLNFGSLETFSIPANLLHLSLSEVAFSDVNWRILLAVLLQCGSLRTLAIRLPLYRCLPDWSRNITVNLSCLSELTFLNADVQDMKVILPFLITPCLKHFYFRGLFDLHTESGIVAPTGIVSGMNSAHSIRTFAAPLQLRMGASMLSPGSFHEAVTKLLACVILDAVELVWIDHTDYKEAWLQPESSPLGRTLNLRFLVQSIFTLFREHPSRANDHTMPEVRVTTSDGQLLYSSCNVDQTDRMATC